MVALERELSPPTIAAISADAIPLRLRRRGGTPRQVLAMTLVGTLILAVFASPDLAGWTERLGDGPVGLAAQNVAVEWDKAMARLGLAKPHRVLRETIRRLLDEQW